MLARTRPTRVSRHLPAASTRIPSRQVNRQIKLSQRSHTHRIQLHVIKVQDSRSERGALGEDPSPLNNEPKPKTEMRADWYNNARFMCVIQVLYRVSLRTGRVGRNYVWIPPSPVCFPSHHTRYSGFPTMHCRRSVQSAKVLWGRKDTARPGIEPRVSLVPEGRANRCTTGPFVGEDSLQSFWVWLRNGQKDPLELSDEWRMSSIGFEWLAHESRIKKEHLLDLIAARLVWITSRSSGESITRTPSPHLLTTTTCQSPCLPTENCDGQEEDQS